MAIMNSARELTADEKRTFRGEPEQVLLSAGTELYKYTSYPLVGSDGRVTPWWMVSRPTWPDDPGLDGHVERAGRLGADPSSLARAGAAVTKQWNGMGGLLRVKLLVPVYAWKGRARWQDVDASAPDPGKVVYIGGRVQVFVPGLTGGDVMRVG